MSSCAPHPTPIEAFLSGHPAALAFAQAPKPAPSSFACESYYGVTAMRFINSDGVSRYGRYRILTDAGNHYLSEPDAEAQEPNYLFDELAKRIAPGSALAPIKFKVAAQLANDGDEVDDATVHWPEDREVFEIGTLSLTDSVADNSAEQKHIIFDPIPRVDGIDPSGDPLLELRAAIYLLSGRRRRAA